MEKSNFIFIAGSAKCGTSSLFEYLLQCRNTIKTPKDFPFFSVKNISEKDNDHYISIFNSKHLFKKNCTFIGSDVRVMSDVNACYKLSKFNSETKIIIILRDPLQKLISQYKFNKSMGLESREINEVIQVELGLAATGKLKKDAYLHACNYPAHIANILTFFPIKNVHIIFYEDFFTENIDINFRMLIKKLNLNLDRPIDYKVFNKTKGRYPKYLDKFFFDSSNLIFLRKLIKYLISFDTRTLIRNYFVNSFSSSKSIEVNILLTENLLIYLKNIRRDLHLKYKLKTTNWKV